jgi:AmmeMemoRadiSam system protein B
MLSDASDTEINGTLKGLIVPHAGYQYSGGVAACAYKLLSQAAKNQSIRKVILLGPAHRVYLDGLAGDPHRAWETPLGITKIDANGFQVYAQAHEHEHSLEVQLPFLQTVLHDFSLTPLVVGNVRDYRAAAEQVMAASGEDALLVISTDLSHFHTYAEAVARDRKTIDAILSGDPEALDSDGEACGKHPALIAMEIARRREWAIELLNYQNSGDVSGDQDSVVGYASMAIVANNFNEAPLSDL